MEEMMTALYGILILIIMVCGLFWPWVDLWVSQKEEDPQEGHLPTFPTNSIKTGKSHA